MALLTAIVVFGGKLVGTMLFEPIAERLGYKYTMYICAAIQIVGLIGAFDVVVQVDEPQWSLLPRYNCDRLLYETV